MRNYGRKYTFCILFLIAFPPMENNDVEYEYRISVQILDLKTGHDSSDKCDNVSCFCHHNASENNFVDTSYGARPIHLIACS